ncbi:MAG TPA: hypothetical protein VMB74_04690 [Streptosporangiaceae bacterium]|nr:hypothetical protein [Streptosporangiaceae bacterium]
MRERKLIEQLAAEIEKAQAAGNDQRARKLADLQCDVLMKIMLDKIADPAEPVLSPAGEGNR